MVKFWCQHSWEKPRNLVLDFLADNSEEKQTSWQFSGKRIKYLPTKSGPQKQNNLSNFGCQGKTSENLYFSWSGLGGGLATTSFFAVSLPRNQTDILYELMYWKILHCLNQIWTIPTKNVFMKSSPVGIVKLPLISHFMRVWEATTKFSL